MLTQCAESVTHLINRDSTVLSGTTRCGRAYEGCSGCLGSDYELQGEVKRSEWLEAGANVVVVVVA